MPRLIQTISAWVCWCALLTGNSVALSDSPDQTHEKYTMSFADSSSVITRKLAHIRKFLWEHMAQKERGVLEATWFTKEGEPNKYNYAIKTDASGNWKVFVTVERQQIPRGRKSGPIQVQHESHVVESLQFLNEDGSVCTSCAGNLTERVFTDQRLQLLEQGQSIQRI